MEYKINTEARKLFADLTMIIIIFSITIFVGSTFAFSANNKPNPAIQNSLYQEECGSCHMAYPSDLLPGKTWDVIIQDLDNHFGEDASLDLETQRAINQYLTGNSANNSSSRRSKKILRSMGRNKSNTNKPLIRISKVPYIKDEHDEVKDFLASRNSEIKQLTQCDSCHADAEKGLFDEDTVDIPNIGAWDD